MLTEKYLLEVRKKGMLVINDKPYRCPLSKKVSLKDIEMIKASLRSQGIKDYTITPLNEEAKKLEKREKKKLEPIRIYS